MIPGIFFPKLFGHNVRKNCSRDREKLLKFDAEGREFAKILRSLKVRQNRNVFFKLTILPKNKFGNCFVRFLEEFEDSKKFFQN